MNEQTTRFASGTETLEGTLTLPAGAGPFPAALLIAGSGPLDRNGDIKRMPLGVSRLLATALGNAGWASFRFDKRGVGASTGDYLATGLFDELADVEAALDHVRSRPEVTDVVAVGHSVGALMAAELGVRHPSLTGVALLSTTVKTGDETLRWQARQLNDHLLPAPINALLKLFRTDLVKQQAKTIRRLEATTSDVARIQLAKVNAKWMREFIAYDPREALRRIEVPVLAITGEKDVQVDADDLNELAETVVTPCTTQVIADVDHILRYEPESVSNPRHYKRQLDKPIDARVIDALTTWLDTLAVGEPPSARAVHESG